MFIVDERQGTDNGCVRVCGVIFCLCSTARTTSTTAAARPCGRLCRVHHHGCTERTRSNARKQQRSSPRVLLLTCRASASVLLGKVSFIRCHYGDKTCAFLSFLCCVALSICRFVSYVYTKMSFALVLARAVDRQELPPPLHRVTLIDEL